MKENIMTSEELAMWKEYELNRNVVNRNKIFNEYFKLAKIIAKKAWKAFGGCVKYDELVQDAGLGLIDAIEKFDYTKGIKFCTYASHRIRGAIMDGQRVRAWRSRTCIEEEKRKIKLGQDISGGIMYLQEMFEDTNFELEAKDNVEDIVKTRLTKKDTLLKIKNAIKELTEREQKVIILYFIKNINTREIATMLGLCQSRISQIKNVAIKKLETKLSGEKASILSCLE